MFRILTYVMPDFIPTLENKLHQFIQQSDYEPMKAHELIRALRMPSLDAREVRHTLREMERKGLIVRLRKNRYGLPETAHLITGQLSVHHEGFGFVTRADDPTAEDIFIPARQIGTGLHGDTVQVALSSSGDRGRATGRPHRRNPKRRGPDERASSSGRVVRVLKRRFEQVAGILTVTPSYSYVIPDHPRITQNVYVRADKRGSLAPLHQHRVVVELLPWEDSREPLPGRLVEDLGPATAPGVEMTGLLRSHGLAEEFPDRVEKDSRKIRSVTSASEEELRRDLRGDLLFTIDPEDARDFDDAISLTRLPDHNWLLSVHIADVAAYVLPDSAIDKEARQRGNSVYLVDRVLTMLPRYLTEEVCSLTPGTDRLAHTARMTLSPRGRLLTVETFPSLIRSRYRFTYDQVQAHLAGETIPDISTEAARMLHDMHQLSESLRRRRARAGSILFDMPEVRCVLDDQGRTTAIVPRKSFTAYHLIEEFMLLANQAVAQRIAEKGYPCIYRIHEAPDDEQWERIVVDLGALGHTLNDTTRAELNAVAEAVAGSPAAHIVNLAMLRNLKRARYADERAEHFGLAFSHYLHFTSPIRRYPDLIAHRVLKAIERQAPPPYSKTDMAAIADHCSRTEREAAEAEMESVDLKRIEYYAAQLDAGQTGPYPALVTSVTGRGLLVELLDTMQRGMVPFPLLQHDHYVVNEERNRAVGRRTRHTWQIGDILEVELLRVDQARKRVDFRPAGPVKPPAAAASRKKAKGRPRRNKH
jgi:ribonuclease R